MLTVSESRAAARADRDRACWRHWLVAVSACTALAACQGHGGGDPGVPAIAAAGQAANTAPANGNAAATPALTGGVANRGSGAIASDAATVRKLREREPRAESLTAHSAQPMVAPAPMAAGSIMPGAPLPFAGPADRERYQPLSENATQQVAQTPVSTFSLDVDTGSYANVRRMLNAGQLPPPDAVRVEEMINYFPYDYARPTGAEPFAVHVETARAPWNSAHLLMRVAIKAQDAARDALPPANLVFLVDVSGSMNSPERLPLLKASLKLLVDALRPQDRVSLVTYASGTAVVLEATPGNERARIANAIDALQPGGSTAGASGIELAYRMASQGFVRGGINRILLATDGDFNVGVTDFRKLKAMVEERRKSGVSLSTLGFGMGNYNEQLMEQLADAGDGAYSYIDSLLEGHKVLVDQMSSTLATVARDVKVQVEFNPAAVAEYRLIGYENRALAREDFNNDNVDAGEIGAGHTMTALYELTPVGARSSADPLRYGAPSTRDAHDPAHASELAFVRVRYKLPEGNASKLIGQAVGAPDGASVRDASGEFRFATAIAGFGQVLRGARYTGDWSLRDARELAAGSVGGDRFGYRAEAVRLIDLAASLRTRAATSETRPTTREGGRS